MRISKVKYSGVSTEIEFATKSGTSDETESKLRSYQLPHPSFVQAMEAFKPLALELLELDDAYGEEFRVSSVSINEEESGRRGIVVTCLKKLPSCNAPLVLNTPHQREPDDEDPENALSIMSDAWVDALDAIERAAIAFVKGKRAQGDMFEQEGEKTDETQIEAPLADGVEKVTISSGKRSVTIERKRPRREPSHA